MLLNISLTCSFCGTVLYLLFFHNIAETEFFWHRIIAAAAPWMTSEQPVDGQIESFDGSMLAEGFQCVMGTGGREPASRRLVGRDADLIESDQQDEWCDQDLLQNDLNLVPHDFR